MKPKKLTLALFFLLFSTFVHAAIWRVNSSLTTDVSQKLFKTINEANSNASVAAGDTLMIEGSAVPYSNATLSKPLILIGPGYFLTQNSQTEADGTPATMESIIIQTAANGSVLEGLTFAANYDQNTPHIQANSIVISRCYCPYAVYVEGNISNLTVIQNYFTGDAIEVNYDQNSFTNVTFKNNYVGSNSGISLNITSSNEVPRVFSSIENNIFSGNVVATTTTFRSNIITANSSATVTVTSANIQNNLTAGGQLTSTGSGNITYTLSSLFVGTTGNSTDGQYQLQTSSPYRTSGYGGTQPGIFGGTQPYVLSGIPPVPSIYEFMADDAANKQTGLPVSIKVKTNL